MAKIIYFDYHGVLDRRTFTGLMQAIGQVAGQTDHQAISAELEQHSYAYMTGSLPPEDFWAMVERLFGNQAVVAGKKYFLHVDPNREVWGLINMLHGQVALGLATDCSPDKKNAIRTAYNLPEFFDTLLFSCDLGLTKHDQEFYKLLLQKGAYQPSDCLLIDHSAEVSSFAGSLGFQTHVFTTVEKLAAVLPAEKKS